MSSPAPEIDQIVRAIHSRQRFVLSSHARPDGDSLGSQLAMAFALTALGKAVTIVNKDAPPATLQPFPGMETIVVAGEASGDFDAAIIMECSDLARTGVTGLDRYFVINIDHHPGNAGYGQINWFDATAAACAEMVFELIVALGVPISKDIATHVYLAILTDTGSFHFSNISPRTFDISRQAIEAGVDPVVMARQVFDSNSMGRLKLLGAMLNDMHVDESGRIAALGVDAALFQATGGTAEDTEGVVNMPLSVKEIVAVAFFKEVTRGEYRVSLRSKGDIDVGQVARQFGGGGHKNAAGCTVHGDLSELRATFFARIGEVLTAV
jgi:phosphoesterase RecJ-like protein